MVRMRIILGVCCLLSAAAFGRAADAPGSSDPGGLKRFQGAEIISYSTRSLVSYQLAKGVGQPGSGFAQSDLVEGALTRAIYRVPAGAPSLEILRNYQRVVKAAGFTQTFELIPGESMMWAGYFTGRLFSQGQAGDSVIDSTKSPTYFTAKGKRGAQDAYIAVFVGESSAQRWAPLGAKDPVVIGAGQALVLVDLVVVKGADSKMVDADPKAAQPDPMYLKHFQGTDPIDTASKRYAQYTLARGGATTPGGFAKSEAVEGAVTRVVYRAPLGVTSLDVIRNYEQMLKAAGFSVTFEYIPGSGVNWQGAFTGKVYAQMQTEADLLGNAAYPAYITAHARKGADDVTVAILAGESGGTTLRKTVIKAGEPVVIVDEVIAKAADDRMVDGTADVLAKSIKATGKVDLYGVYFDVDKTAVKPESKATLDEVAKMLKADATLKVEVAGHTDNTGAAAHNATLSKGRADAVVQALVTTYGIAATRLVAKGYGDTKPVAPNDTEPNRAKNRRVELRKLAN
jgi:OOP family OmpA-OmpF porin